MGLPLLPTQKCRVEEEEEEEEEEEKQQH